MNIQKLFVLTAAVLLAVKPLSVSGSPVIDQKGSITLDYQDSVDGKKPVTGAAFSFYKVATFSMKLEGKKIHEAESSSIQSVEPEAEQSDSRVKETDHGATIVIEEPEPSEHESQKQSVQTATLHGGGFQSVIPGLSIDASTEAVKIAGTVQKAYQNDVTGGAVYPIVTDSNGLAAIRDVDPGIYLAIETKSAAKHHVTMPFLVSCPYMNQSCDGWIYDVKVSPKSNPDRVGTKTQDEHPVKSSRAVKAPSAAAPVKTGDTRHPVLYLVLLFCALVFTLVNHKRRHSDDIKQ